MNTLDVISRSFWAAFVLPAICFVFSNKLFYPLLMIALIIMELIVYYMKKVLGNDGIFARPKGAFGCCISCKSTNDEGKPAFPSGHVAVVAMFTLSMYYYTRSHLVALVSSVWLALMMYSRYAKKCHNIFQISGGIIVGMIGAIIFCWTYGSL